MGEELSNLGTPRVDAAEETNTIGERTPILTFQPVDGLRMVVRNRADGKAGIPMIAELQDSSGNDLPLDTELVLRWDAPHLDQPQVVSETLRNIRVYRDLTLTEQQNEDYRDRTRIKLKGKAVEVHDIEEFEVAILSSTQIDWANSRLQFEGDAVDVVSK